MVKRVLFVLVATAAGPAFAQPALTPVQPAPSQQPLTPTIVTPTYGGQLAPWIQRGGNLRLSISCGELFATTPEDGLDVQIDGAPLDPQRVGSFNTGYLVAPGHHRVQLSAPGCVPAAFEFDADPLHSTHAEGRLVLSDWSRGGTAGSPNGFGFTAGAWFEPVPHGPGSNSIFQQTASYDDSNTATGAFLSMSHERRYFVTSFDMAIAGGSTAGVVTGDSGRETARFTASVFDNLYQFRIGARLPLHYASLAAGTGLGFNWWITSGKLTDGAGPLFAPDSPDASFYFPMWGSVTVKATCEWGVQALGQYDLHPGSPTSGGFSFGAGIIYQPSSQCREAPGVRVSTN
ncbi:MAG TPA: hypothetical protein VGM88_04915 [Kofleriaceae bacterium]|jgi:hypothetical protein